jgi:hypothetical protein
VSLQFPAPRPISHGIQGLLVPAPVPTTQYRVAGFKDPPVTAPDDCCYNRIGAEANVVVSRAIMIPITGNFISSRPVVGLL